MLSASSLKTTRNIGVCRRTIAKETADPPGRKPIDPYIGFHCSLGRVCVPYLVLYI